MKENQPIDFELFLQRYGINVIGLTLKCSVCGNKWGLSVWEEKDISEIKEDKLKCYHCDKKSSIIEK